MFICAVLIQDDKGSLKYCNNDDVMLCYGQLSWYYRKGTTRTFPRYENIFSLQETSNIFKNLPIVLIILPSSLVLKHSNGGWWPARVADGVGNYQKFTSIWLLTAVNFSLLLYFTANRLPSILCAVGVILTSYHLFKWLSHTDCVQQQWRQNGPAALVQLTITISRQSQRKLAS